jgi:hypothetical protein
MIHQTETKYKYSYYIFMYHEIDNALKKLVVILKLIHNHVQFYFNWIVKVLPKIHINLMYSCIPRYFLLKNTASYLKADIIPPPKFILMNDIHILILMIFSSITKIITWFALNNWAGDIKSHNLFLEWSNYREIYILICCMHVTQGIFCLKNAGCS